MRATILVGGLMLPLLALAQNTPSPSPSPSPPSSSGPSAPASGTISPSPSPPVSLQTIVTTGVSLGAGRSMVSFTSTIVNTITLSNPVPTGNASNSNSTSSNTTTSSTPTGPLPTAPTNIDGGGDGPNGAPSPGASSPLGIFGPDDSFTSWVLGLHVNKMLLVVAGAAVGGTLVLV